MKKNHIRPTFATAIRRQLQSDIDNVHHKTASQEHVTAGNLVAIAFAGFARSCMQLLAESLTPAEHASMETVHNGRNYFKRLCEAAAMSSLANPLSRAATPVSQSHSQDGTPEPRTSTVKSKQYRADQNRPNVHVGVHYPEMAKEYGLVSNSNVYIGEDQHRYVCSNPFLIDSESTASDFTEFPLFLSGTSSPQISALNCPRIASESLKLAFSSLSI